MSLFEISALFFFVGSLVTAVVYGLYYVVKRIKANIRMIEEQQQFYLIASKWFYNHMGD